MKNNVLNYRTETVEKSAFVLAFFTFLGGFLSILRNALLASYFGASKIVDIYYASFRIPDFIFNILILGALAAGFIPLFIKYSKQSQEESYKFASSVITGILLLSVILGIIFIIFANAIVSRLFPGFDSTSLKTIAALSRIMMIQPIFLGLATIIGNILQVHNLFVPQALAPLLYNTGIIIGIVVFYPIFGIYGLSYGVILGAFLNLLVKYIPFKRINFKFLLPAFDQFKHYLKEFFSLTAFRALSIINIQLFLFVISYLSSFLKEGSLSIITFATNIQDAPRTIFAMSLAIAVFPTLSKCSAEQNKTEFTKIFSKTITEILLFIVPIFFGFLVFREQIIRLLLGYGHFNWEATFTTISVFTILSFGFIFQCLHDFLLNVLFASNNTFAPFVSGVFSYGIGALAAFSLSHVYGIKGIAFGYMIANICYALLLFLNSLRYLDLSFLQPLFKKIAIIFIAALLSSLLGFWSLLFLRNIFNTAYTIQLFISTALSAFLMLLAYLFIIIQLKWEEVRMIKSFIKQKIFRR